MAEIWGYNFVLKQQQGWSNEDVVLNLWTGMLAGFLWVNPSIEGVLHHTARQIKEIAGRGKAQRHGQWSREEGRISHNPLA